MIHLNLNVHLLHVILRFVLPAIHLHLDPTVKLILALRKCQSAYALVLHICDIFIHPAFKVVHISSQSCRRGSHHGRLITREHGQLSTQL